MKMELERAILESPYGGDTRVNRIFAEYICREKLWKGFNCFASHLFYSQFLKDELPAERELGIRAGLQWAEGVSKVFFALPTHQMMPTAGMWYAYREHVKAGREIHCGIYNGVGNLMYEIPHEWFFSEDGWVVWLKREARDA